MSPKEKLSVLVTLDDDHREQPKALLTNLKNKGFILSEALEALGILTGTIPPSSLESIRNLKGVLAVEEERMKSQIDD